MRYFHEKRWYFGSRAIAPSTYYVTTGEHPQSEVLNLGLKLNKNTIYRGFEPVSFRCRLYFCFFSGRKIVKIRLIPLKLNTLQGQKILI